MRASVGVAIPLIVGQLSGHTVAGVAAAVGALQAGFASFQGTYRSRATVVLAASMGMALSVVVGATVGHVVGIDMLLVSLWGFGAGMLVALGQAASVVGIQAVVVLVVYSQFTLTPAAALRQAGLVVAGGVLQIVLIVVIWPFRRYPAERRALGQVYAQLAENARRIISDAPSRPAAALADLAPILHDPQPFGGSIETAAHNGLAYEAERIQLELTALGRAKQRLSALGAADAAAALNEITGLVAASLDELAGSLREARSPMGPLAGRDQFAAALNRINPESAHPITPADEDRWTRAARQEAYQRAQALAGQLRAARRYATVPAGRDPGALEGDTTIGDGADGARFRHLERLGDNLTTLRANLTFSSEACRHAVRLAVALALAVGIADLIDLPHHYWLPLTVMIVLKPDFSSTFARGFNRIAGTLLGAGVVTIAIRRAPASRDGPHHPGGDLRLRRLQPSIRQLRDLQRLHRLVGGYTAGVYRRAGPVDGGRSCRLHHCRLRPGAIGIRGLAHLGKDGPAWTAGHLRGDGVGLWPGGVRCLGRPRRRRPARSAAETARRPSGPIEC